jgi:PAS domain S-box-containing protein
MNQADKIGILLVDDKPANLLALKSLLQNDDYDLVTASSGHDALRALLRRPFALVLLDVLMPGLDGFETARLLRERDSTTYTPIIFITAASPVDREVIKGYELGAVDYIFKPIVPEILRAKVQVFVELYRRAEQIKSQTAQLETAQAELRRQFAEHLQAEKAMRESEEKYRLLFGAAREAIVVFDKRTRQVIDSNEAAAKLYESPRRQLHKLTAEELFADPNAQSEAPALGSRSMAKELAVHQRSRAGRSFPAELAHWTCTLNGREVVVVIVRDTTERRRAEEANRLLAREAMQRDFVATVSHELRTPIAAIKGFAETLRTGGLDDAKNRLRFIRIIEKHADKLGWLVEDILTLNALESGKLKPEPEPIALGESIERLVEGLGPLAARREVQMTVSVPKEASALADARHFSRIMHNLLDNSIKYNKRGGRVFVESRLEGNHHRVSLRDTGIGISGHDLPLIFQQFHRSETAKASAVGGNGLGLYIIKSLVESNGGQIWAESSPGEGSTFHFTVPAAPAVASSVLVGSHAAKS